MKALCKMFGHKRDKGWWGDGLYGEVKMAGTDGTGRRHAAIYLECDRCGDSYVAARFHPASKALSSQPQKGEWSHESGY
jgi:hypothetical protein